MSSLHSHTLNITPILQWSIIISPAAWASQLSPTQRSHATIFSVLLWMLSNKLDAGDIDRDWNINLNRHTLDVEWLILHCSVFSRNTTKVHHSTPGLWNQLSLYQNILPTNNCSSFKIKTSGNIFRSTWLRISTTSVTKCTRGAGFLIKYENSTQIFQWLIPLFSVLDKLSVEDDNSEIVCCECDDYLQDEKKWAPLAHHLSLPHHLLQLLLWVEYFNYIRASV